MMMYNNSSDTESQNLTTLDCHTSLMNGCHNESSSMPSNFTRYVDPQWSDRSETNSVIFLALVIICMSFVLIKFSCCWRRAQDESSRRLSGIRVASVHGDTTKEIKTEEYITNRLVLKHVVKYAMEQHLDTERATRLENPTESTTFCKSDLAIPAGGGDSDELDQENDSAVCAICLCEYEVGDQICWSNNRNCRHHFHSACGIAWLAKHSECPVCRSLYLVEPPGDDPTKTISSTETTQVEVETGDANDHDRSSTVHTVERESDASQNRSEHLDDRGDSNV